jgi:hypothetical protein
MTCITQTSRPGDPAESGCRDRREYIALGSLANALFASVPADPFCGAAGTADSTAAGH